jgi:hypothetical protein
MLLGNMTSINNNLEIADLNSCPEYLEEAIALIEKEFKYSELYSYKEDFPQLFTEQNLSNLYVALYKERVVGTLFTRPQPLIFQEIKIPSLFLGGICTHADFQKQGIFTALYQHIDQFPYTLLFLWSDLTGLYEKLSFYEVGVIYEYALPHQGEDQQTFEAQPQDLFRNLKNDFLIPERTLQDWKFILNHQSMNKEFHSSFYQIKDKGMDLQNIIHDWAPIQKETSLENFIGNTLWSPIELNTIHKKTEKYLGFCKLNNPLALNPYLLKNTQNKLEVIKKEGELIYIRFEDQEFDIDEKFFLQSIFGPNTIDEYSHFFPKLWIPGYDSI